MYCPKCNAQVADGSAFCTVCGSPFQAPAQLGMTPPFAPPQMQTPYAAPAAPYAQKPKKKGKTATVVFACLTALFLVSTIALTIGCLSIYSDATHYRSKADNLEEKYDEILDEYKFYHKYAVVYNDDENIYYHHFDCPYFNDDSFRIYNINMAQAEGIKPCPYCIKD